MLGGCRTLNNSSNWLRVSIALGFAILVLSVLYIDTLTSMVQTWWESGTYTHGFLVLPISVYLIWLRRYQICHISPQPSPWGLLLLFGFSFTWFVADAANIIFLTQLSLVAMLISLTLTILGVNFIRATLFPMAFLFFAVPLGEDLVPPMMDLTGRFTVSAIQLTGIPVFFEGRYISLPSGDWVVAEACSGVRYLIASVVLGCVYAYLSYKKWWKRLLFVALSILLPILANGLRAFGIVMLGHFSDMKIAVGVDHIIYGWLFFGLVMFLMFWVGSFWYDEQAAEDEEKVTSSNEFVVTEQSYLSSSFVSVISFFSILVILLGPAASKYSDYVTSLNSTSISLPSGQLRWQGPFDSVNAWSPIFPGAMILHHKEYASAKGSVQIYLVHYGKEVQGKELISSTNSLYDTDFWLRISESTRDIKITKDLQMPIHEVVLRSDKQRRVLWYWYDIFGEFTANPWVGKFWGAVAKLGNDNVGSTLIGISANYKVQPKTARKLLQSFMTDITEIRMPGSLLGVTR